MTKTAKNTQSEVSLNFSHVLDQFPEGNFLQSPEWAKTNRLIGAESETLKLPENGYALAIIRNARRGRYLEISCGPLINWQNEQVVKQTIEILRETAKKHHAVFVRLRPQLMNTPENLAILKQNGLKKAPMHLAAEHTVIINLKKYSEDELLKNMRRQTRYEVRRAKKLGITIEKSASEAIFHKFYHVQQETAKIQNFVPPDEKTLLAEHEAFGENAQIYVAYSENHEPIAYGLIISGETEADYYEAASTPLHKKLPGAYALLWAAIKDAKNAGIPRFNLWGIAPKNQPHHRYAGVTTFKTGFGGEVVEFVPAQDLVISPFKYYLKDYVVESFRRKVRHL